MEDPVLGGAVFWPGLVVVQKLGLRVSVVGCAFGRGEWDLFDHCRVIYFSS